MSGEPQCTITAAAIHYETGNRRPMAEFGRDSLVAHLAYFMTRRRSYAAATFDGPRLKYSLSPS